MEYGLGEYEEYLCKGLQSVLILIVVEYGLGELIDKRGTHDSVGVLILIVVEYGLGGRNFSCWSC